MKILKPVFIIAIVAVAMIGIIIPNVFAIHHQSSDTLPESFTVSETPNAPFQSYYQEVLSKSNPSSPAPGFYEISQYAIGTVGIQIIFVESNGSVDPSKYDWSESKMKIAEANIKKGLEFLEDKYPYEAGKLEFSYRQSMIGETGVEASTRVTDGWFQLEDLVELVEDTLTDTGCGSKTDPLATKGFHWPGDKYRIHVLSCGNEVRDELNTDWATVIFVPYTATQVDGLAFGFTEGAFIQDSYMTTVNGGGVIPAHEWTHMVGTTDMIECDLFGPEHEACGEKAGYLYMEETDTIPMTNCLLGSTGNNDSIPRLCISDGTKHQMGWVDENGNNIPDIVENDVIVTLSENQKQSNSSVIVEGTIMLEPVKCKWPQNSPSWWNDWSCKDTTINKIIEVTSIPNVGIESKDGEFDSAFEEFTITVDPLKFDNMEIEIQVKDKITNTIHSIPVQLNITEFEMTETDEILNMKESISGPTWIKDIFLWYEEDQISEDDLINVIRFLVSEGIVDLDEKSLKEKILSNEISNDAIQVPDLTISPAVGYEKYFTKHVNIFGIPIYATSSSSDAKVLHAANVLAQYLDNNADGIPDNPLVVEKLKETNSAIPFFANEWEDETSKIWNDFSDVELNCWIALYADETNPRNQFDASLEEILHVITQCGYGEAYPEIFAEKEGSALSNAMTNAIESRHYNPFVDERMPFGDQHTEYIYWALTSILGAQENRDWEDIQEWKLNTKEKIMEGDPDIYNLLTEPEYKFPTILPDGNYNPTP